MMEMCAFGGPDTIVKWHVAEWPDNNITIFCLAEYCIDFIRGIWLVGIVGQPTLSE